MTRNQLTQLNQEELIDLILVLQSEVEALRLKLEKIQKPPTNSSNSSQPPSRDQKSNLPAKRKRQRHGPPLGHEKHEREFVADPEHRVDVKPQVCEHCQTDLRQEAQELVDVNQITEIPQAHAEVIEVRQYATVCPRCGQEQVGQPPAGLEMNRTFGARLENMVVYYRQEQHMSYARTQEALQCLNDVEISQGGIDQIMQRAGRGALKQVGAIQTEIQSSAVIYSDETSSRVDGGNWWQWVFGSSRAVLHVIRFNRSEDVIRDVMAGHEAEVWVSDCLPAQLKAPARERQLCMAHQIRNLQALIDRYPKYSWPREMQALFRFAIHLHHQRNQLSPPQFLAQVRKIERRCNQLLRRTLRRPEAAILLRRYRKYRDSLFVFLHRTDVEPTNNFSERNLRPSVIHRKVIGCFRSGWGARTYAALASVIDTAALKGTSPFDAIQNLFGTPALPLPAGV
ncbi:MAG TPA: IS66 family transposase [Anaerolineales bacterium]